MPGVYPFDTASWQHVVPNGGGQLFFLDNSNANKADNPANGSYAAPFSTGAYAVTQCTAAAGDSIFVMPGHTETVATLLALTTKSRVSILAPHLGLLWTMSSVTGSLEAPSTGRVVSRAAAVLPATTTATIFTVVGGPVLVRELYGVVVTVIAGAGTTLVVTTTATGLAAVTISGTSADLDAAAVGTVISLTGTLATAPTVTANQTHIGQATPTFIGPGAIRLTTGGTATGTVAWYCRYEPLAPGAYVIAA